MTKLRALWHRTVDSLWFLPAVMTFTGGVLAILLIRFNDDILGDVEPQDLWWLFGGSAEGAQGVLGAIAGSIMTVTGVVFSVTIVALQLASSQFTPRVLRTFTADRANQVVLGVFIGTFTYTLIVQRTLRSETDGMDAFVPNVAVTGAVVLALTSIGFLIFFINHAARAIQASVIIDAVARDTLRVVANVFPERRIKPDAAPPIDVAASLEGEWCPVLTRKAGYIQDVDTAHLADLARRHQVTIRTEHEVGLYVLPGQALAAIWPAADARDIDAEILDAFVLGFERTPHRDVKLGVVELMDIAVKALSPSVNDPTTALNAIERLGEVLLELAWRKRGDDVETEGGRVLVIRRLPTLADTVDLAFNQVRRFAADNPSVSIRLMDTLADLAVLAPADSRAPFIEHLLAVKQSAELAISDPGDLVRVSNVASRALARANAAA